MQIVEPVAGAGQPMGYALVHLRGPEETWTTGERGRGIGSVLFERMYDQLRGLGVHEVEVAVISKNAAALRFYERQGMVPFTVSYLGPVPRPR
ncbi:MAG: GNAT family N-acetyltransferase [Thermoleophilaceae bacterium]|nr:GNAT family N-acetyltransferase [Thermoleophilaceae bacterium]